MPVYSKVKKSVGTSGLAEIRPLKGGSLRVIFADGDQYQIDGSDFKYPAGKYQVTLSQLNDKILFLQPPPSTTHLVRFEQFSNRQNEVPEPSIRRGGTKKSKTGGTYFQPDELVFVAKLVVVAGDYEGLNIPFSLPYAFENYPGTNFTMITAKQSRLVKIEEFLRISGLDLVNEDIPFSDNVLPWLEKKFQAAAKVFQVTLNDKGFVDQLVEVPEFLLPPDLLKKSKKAPKKVTKKSKK